MLMSGARCVKSQLVTYLIIPNPSPPSHCDVQKNAPHLLVWRTSALCSRICRKCALGDLESRGLLKYLSAKSYWSGTVNVLVSVPAFRRYRHRTSVPAFRRSYQRLEDRHRTSVPAYQRLEDRHRTSVPAYQRTSVPAYQRLRDRTYTDW